MKKILALVIALSAYVLNSSMQGASTAVANESLEDHSFALSTIDTTNFYKPLLDEYYEGINSESDMKSVANTVYMALVKAQTDQALVKAIILLELCFALGEEDFFKALSLQQINECIQKLQEVMRVLSEREEAFYNASMPSMLFTMVSGAISASLISFTIANYHKRTSTSCLKAAMLLGSIGASIITLFLGHTCYVFKQETSSLQEEIDFLNRLISTFSKYA